jgi:hypothetical protein
MFVMNGANVTATECAFMENHQYGVSCDGANTKARLDDCQLHPFNCKKYRKVLGSILRSSVKE